MGRKTFVKSGFDIKTNGDDILPLAADVEQAADVQGDAPDMLAETPENKKHRFKKTTTAAEKQPESFTKAEREALKRRTRRLKKKEHNMECFLCRGKGHSIKSCPRNKDNSICYRCGSLEHTLKECPKQLDSKNPMPYAFCFECKQKGHLVGQVSLFNKVSTKSAWAVSERRVLHLLRLSQAFKERLQAACS